jgi:hypothetical protein
MSALACSRLPKIKRMQIGVDDKELAKCYRISLTGLDDLVSHTAVFAACGLSILNRRR